MNLINMLRFYKVTPLVVFDGQPLPMKQETNSKRTEKRKEALNSALKLYEQGQTTKAMPYFQQLVSITQEMVQQVIKSLDEINVKSIIAPYEADPQLAYLVKKGYAHAVVTEDSDLLAFGCTTVIFKLDRYGEGKRIYFNDIPMAIDLSPFNEKTFRHICMLSGCDYLPSMKGVGLKTSVMLMQKHKLIEKLFERFSFKKDIKAYAEEFPRADNAFLYQFVYDINSRKHVRFNELPENFNEDHLPSLGTNPQDSVQRTDKQDPAIFMSAQYIKDNKENIPPWLKYRELSDSCKESQDKPSSSPDSTSGNTQKAEPAQEVKKASLVDRFRAVAQSKPIITKKEDIKKDVVTSYIVRKYSFSSSRTDNNNNTVPSLTTGSTLSSSQEKSQEKATLHSSASGQLSHPVSINRCPISLSRPPRPIVSQPVKPIISQSINPIVSGKRKYEEDPTIPQTLKKRILGDSTNTRFL
ncbi:unnamed protein product [Rhizopus stolonifer]